MGGSLRGKNILVIDDVITAGTAMREALDIVSREGGRVVGFVVALDRMERMPSPDEKQPGTETGVEQDGQGEVEGDGEGTGMSAMGQIRKEYGVTTTSIVTLEDLIVLVKEKGKEMGLGQDGKDMERLEEYRRRYRASD